MSQSKTGRDLVATTAIILLGCLLTLAAAHWRDPGLVARWPIPQLLFAGGNLVATGAAAALIRRRAKLAILAAVLPVAAMSLAGFAAYRASGLRTAVIAAPQSDLREAAGHVVAGFYDMDEARALARLGIAGLFLSPRNIRGLSAEAIARDIGALQDLRRIEGLPPLWIAVDQEGGLVATLSPPLPRPAPLATVASDSTAVTREAKSVGRDLARLGVTVNFAPVVDVTRGHLDSKDRNSKIALRSLSSDPDVVTRGADAYCRALAESGVRCTIKHFPGLGDVTADTHVTTVHRASLDARDIDPFRHLTAAGRPKPWVMLSHLVVDALDREHPASASPTLIAISDRHLITMAS